jgi:hypothetical protein
VKRVRMKKIINKVFKYLKNPKKKCLLNTMQNTISLRFKVKFKNGKICLFNQRITYNHKIFIRPMKKNQKNIKKMNFREREKGALKGNNLIKSDIHEK